MNHNQMKIKISLHNTSHLLFIDTRYIAVTHGKHIQVWVAPGHTKEFAPFVLHRTYTGHYDDTTCIDWSADSRYHPD